MRHQDPRVPAEVEEYLVGLYTRAGQLGAGIGADVGFPGGDLVRRGRPPQARGVTWVARQLTTVVEERTVPARLLLWDVRRLLASRYPKSHRLDTSDDVIRLAVPVRRTGLQRAVVDVTRSPDAGDDYLIRVFCKEGLVSRQPTRRIADEVAQCLSGTAAAT